MSKGQRLGGSTPPAPIAERQEVDMTTIDMTEAGKQHFYNNKKCIPSDCIDIDEKILKNAPDERLARCKFYSEMRGAFNNGWANEYFKSVGLKNENVQKM